ncbi:MAG: sigma-54 dependent transcriptional regulator [Myxococcota bacterium]
MSDADATILLVDDEAAHLKTLEKLFSRKGYDVLTAEHGQLAVEILRERDVDLVITDLMMPKLDGMELLELVRTLRPGAEVIVMSAFGTIERAVAAIKVGAYDFITKPIKRDVILEATKKALERRALKAENRALKAQLAELKQSPHGIVGASHALRQSLEMAQQAARSDATVMLTGESGTGKELFARLIYKRSERADGPFVAVNCAAIPETILEAELFGYEKGAFTGATSRRIGRFEAADGGTLFLDEIAEVPLLMQVKLLRFVQEGTFERLGSNTTRHADVRIIAATHRDLEDEMARGNFREDLFYRLHVVPITIPPLRHRSEDVPLLAEHFLAVSREKNQRDLQRIAPEALDTLSAYSWPGNVRELENTIERAVVLDRDGVLDVDDLPSHIHERGDERRAITIPLGTPLDDVEATIIRETLKMTGGNKKLAASLLNISARTIYRKL